jgi:hypothetical protein
MFFFCFHLKCERRTRKGLTFLLNLFFIVEWLGNGRGLFFLQIHYGERGWLKVAISKILGIHGFEFISLFFFFSFRMSSTPST